MIPRPYITEWREYAPWKTDLQVEQDLILSRILVEIYNDPFLAENLLFRGGTALHKLFLNPAVRYSEDLDFVQRMATPIGELMETIRKICNPLLGKPKTQQKKDSAVFIYKTESEIPPILPIRIKIEIQAIMNRKNAYFYKTLNGAKTGDIFMSIIQTCRLENVNALDYLIQLQKHTKQVNDHPHKWMPWNYQITMTQENLT